MEITNEMLKVVEQIAQTYREQITRENSIASGELKAFKTECKMEGSFFEVIFELQHYWKYVENGRRAGAKFPPVDAIKKWIEIKPIVPRPINGKIPSTSQLAYLIGRKIARDGIKPKQLLKKSLEVADGLIQVLVGLIAEQMQKDINNEIVDIINE